MARSKPGQGGLKNKISRVSYIDPAYNSYLEKGPEKVKAADAILTTLPTECRMVYETCVLAPYAEWAMRYWC